MTAREMQMEFERRITLMNPDFELKEKVTSDTIFSFLNAYTERYVRNNYLYEDQVQDGTRAQKKNADALKGLITRGLYNIAEKDALNTDKTSDRVLLPDDYFLYIRSNSILTQNYKTAPNPTGLEGKKATQLAADGEDGNIDFMTVTPNKVIREDDVEKVISTYYNKAIILNPYVVLNKGNNEDVEKHLYLNVIHDEYTVISKVDLVYYRKPKRFDVIGVDGVNVLNQCELPENVHMEIVEGAVEMFITEAKYRLNMKQPDNNTNNPR